MKFKAIPSACFFLLVSCSSSTASPNIPITLVGTVSNPSFTGWYRDYCDNGNLVKGLPNCLQTGGEIYKAVLLNAHTENGSYSVKKLIIAFPAHAIPNGYRAKHRVSLVKTPQPFQNTTGISFLANEWDSL